MQKLRVQRGPNLALVFGRLAGYVAHIEASDGMIFSETRGSRGTSVSSGSMSSTNRVFEASRLE
jgi:hypothetical protein